jgi:tetratricopeptide (TPR) repeat protein
MSFDKTKAMRSAERFLSQGKIRAAIGEYKRIVENDPKDFSTLNVLGDLYAKGSEAAEAVNCFTQVAEHYSKQGFAQKAIAIYNKISRLQPNSADVSAKLAQLYQLKGSFAEARSHYVALAEQYQSRGQKSEALEIWKQVAQLDPNNTEVYLKIAEFCVQSEQPEEAAKSYTEAGLRLANLNQQERALDAFTRALAIRPFELPALNGFVKTQIRLGNSDEAAKRLEEILERQPYNREILYMLVDCYIDSNNPPEAEKSVIRLVEQEPANYPKFLQLVELYLKNDDLPAAVRILSMSSEHLLVGGKPEEFFKWTNEILARNPEQLDALRLLVRYYGWQRDETELKNALERLAEIARLHESVDDEHYALSQLVMILPHEVSYARRLQEIAQEYGFAPEMPAADYSLGADAALPAEAEELTAFAVVEVEESAAALFDDYVAYESEVGLSEAETAFPDEGSAFAQNEADIVSTDFAFVAETLDAESGDFGGSALGGAADPPLTASDEMRLGQEVESLEFYITQGYLDLADKTLSGLEAEFGARPEFAALRAQLGETGAAETTESKALPEVELIVAAEPAGAESYDFLSDFRSDLGFEDAEPAVEEGDYETHYQTAIVYKEMGLMEEAIREFQDAVNLVRPDDGTRRFFQCCNLLGLCFMERAMPNLALMWYRRALETPGLNDEEKQALFYETGIAYEMGGEKPKALEYFEQIYAVNVDYRDVSSRLESLRACDLVM